MARAILQNVTLDYPIYGSRQKSLRQALFARTGGRVQVGEGRSHRVSVRALDAISLEFKDGDRVGLVGHNGAGKSTLLRVLAGVYEPTDGTITVEGRRSPLFNAAPGLDIEDSGYENIKTCGMYLGMTPEQIEKSIPDIVEFTELGEYLSLPVRSYSSGMVTRLSFAIATSIDPDILLLDEGLGTGDARFAARAEERMKSLINRSSILVLASHADDILRSMCSSGILMEKGRIIEMGPIGPVLRLYHERASRAANT